MKDKEKIIFNGSIRKGKDDMLLSIGTDNDYAIAFIKKRKGFKKGLDVPVKVTIEKLKEECNP